MSFNIVCGTNFVQGSDEYVSEPLFIFLPFT